MAHTGISTASNKAALVRRRTIADGAFRQIGRVALANQVPYDIADLIVVGHHASRFA